MRVGWVGRVAITAGVWLAWVEGRPDWPAQRAVAAEPSTAAPPGALESSADEPTGALESSAAEPPAATRSALPNSEIPAPPTARRGATDGLVEPEPRPAGESPDVAVPTPGTAPARRVRVELVDGRSFDGTIDPRTDGEQLWLCRRHGTAVVRRPLDWAFVARVELAGQSLSGGQLRAAVEQVRRELPLAAAVAPREKTIFMRCLAAPDAAAAMEPFATPAADATDAPRREGRQAGRVEWLAIEATAANWNADLENDGLLLVVEPRDAEGRIVAVRGRLDVELFGRRWGVVRQAQPYGRIGHWSLSVEPGDFGPLGARYRLEFQGVQPEFDARLAPHGAVHGRLSVPGRGVFEASDASVRLRPYSAARDEQQQFTGRRFFPG